MIGTTLNIVLLFVFNGVIGLALHLNYANSPFKKDARALMVLVVVLMFVMKIFPAWW